MTTQSNVLGWVPEDSFGARLALDGRSRDGRLHAQGRGPLNMAGEQRNRNVRVDDLWDRALAVARARGETLSAVIRAALERYVKRHEKDEP
jgi:hypothetical protein